MGVRGKGLRKGMQGEVGVGYRGRGHSPRTRPAAESGAASRSLRGPGQTPHGLLRRNLLPWPAPAGGAPPCLQSLGQSGRPRPRQPVAAAAVEGAGAASTSNASWERALAAAGARRAGPSPHPPHPQHWSTHGARALRPALLPPPPTLSGLTCPSQSQAGARGWAPTAPHKVESSSTGGHWAPPLR